MSMRFVSPETVRIQLADGVNWIQIKKDLTAREFKEYTFAGVGDITPSTDTAAQRLGMAWKDMAFTRAFVYLVDWSAKDDNGKDIPLTRDALERMEEVDFDEIDKLIAQHREQREQEKKAQNSKPTPTEPSA